MLYVDKSKDAQKSQGKVYVHTKDGFVKTEKGKLIQFYIHLSAYFPPEVTLHYNL